MASLTTEARALYTSHFYSSTGN